MRNWKAEEEEKWGDVSEGYITCTRRRKRSLSLVLFPHSPYFISWSFSSYGVLLEGIEGGVSVVGVRVSLAELSRLSGGRIG